MSDYRVTVRVQFDDGSTTEISRKLHYSSAGLHSEGDILPVRYDPADHSKIEIDVPALKARRKARLANDTAWKESLIAQAESQVARSASSGGRHPQAVLRISRAGKRNLWSCSSFALRLGNHFRSPQEWSRSRACPRYSRSLTPFQKHALAPTMLVLASR